MDVNTPQAPPQPMDKPTSSSSSSQTQVHSWKYGEMRDLITMWGEEEIQHQLIKGYHNRDVFKLIAQKMHAQDHNRD